MSEFAGRISRPRPERAGVCNATRLATRLPNGLSPAAENEYSLSFNGVDQSVDTGLIPDFINTNATLSFWCNMDNLTGFQALGCYSSGKQFYVGFNGTNAGFALQATGKSSTDISSYIAAGKWHHICFVADGGTARYYVDGVSRDTHSYTPDASANPDTPLYIGAIPDGSGGSGIVYPMEGDVDEVSIWSAALSAEAVAAVYNSGRPIDLNYGRGDYANSADLVSWWRMGDINLGGGDTVPDAAGSNDGTLVNEPAYTVDNPPNYSNWALGFDGVDQYGTSAGDATLASKSYSFWAKSDDTGRNDIFDHGDDNIGGFEFNGPTALLYLNSTSGGGAYYRYWADNAAQDDNAWHHWVVYIEHDDISNCKLYCDGVVQGVIETNTTGSAAAYTTGIRIGRGADNYFEGSLDEFAIFDGELTNAQVNEIFRAGKPGTLDGMNPEHWFRMGENNSGTGDWVTDMGSEGDDLALYNSPTFERSVPAADASWNNRSIEFDGVDQYVDLGTSSTLNPANITIAMWVKPDALTDWDYLFTRGQADYNEAYRFEVGSANLYASFGNGSSNGNISKAHGMSNGTWYHVALTYDGATATLFVDGASIGTESISIEMEQATRTTTIGQPLTSHGGYFDGQIDSVGLWSRALTAAQILEIYNGGIPFDLSGHLPVAWYRMGDLDNPGGTTIRDFGINLAPPSELVTNGDFDSGTTSWTAGSNGTLSWQSGVLRVTTSGGAGSANQVIALSSGATFTLTFDVVAETQSSGIPFVQVTSGLTNTGITSTGSHTIVFTATSNNSTLTFSLGGAAADGEYLEIDNVSVKQVLYGNPGALQNSPTWTTDTP